jgi:hypothetical protein
MDAEILLNLIFLLALALVAIVLSVFIQIRGSTKKRSRAFVLVMMDFALAAIFSCVMLLDVGESASLLLARIAAFCYIMSYTSFLYLVLILIRGDVSKTTLTTRMFFLSFLIIAIFSGFTIEIEQVGEGSWALSGAGLMLIVSMTAALAIVSSLLLLSQYDKDENNCRKEQSVLFILAVTSPLYLEISIGVLLLLGMDDLVIVHPIESTGFVLFLAYATLKYQIKVVLPSSKPSAVIEMAKTAQRNVHGKSYIVESRKSSIAYSILVEEINRGAEGLVVSREHPDRIRESYGLAKMRIIWLTNFPGQDHIDPTNIMIIQRTISDFLETSKRPVVLMDGVEVFLLDNKVSGVLQMLFDLRDEFITSEGTFILSVDPRTIEEPVLAMLEKDFDVLQNIDR